MQGMACAQCGATVMAGQTTCEACGAQVRQGGSAVAQDDIAGLLADATLLRTWGQYAEAINVCIRIVRLDAHNALAHSLLGDLYRDQGNHREALGWYKLAVQLEPGNEIVRRKLDEMIDYVFQGVTRNDAQAAVVINPSEPHTPGATTSGRRRSWQQRLQQVQPVHLVLGCTGLAIVGVLLCMLAPALTPHRSPDTDRSVPVAPAPAPTQAPSADAIAPSAGNPPVSPGGQAPSITPPAPDAVEGGGKTIPGLTGIVVTPKASTPESPAPAPTPTPAPAQRTSTNGVASADTAVPPLTHEVLPYQVPPTLSSSGSDDQRTAMIRAALEHTAKDPKMPFTLDQLSIDPRGHIQVEYSVPNVGGVSETKRGLIYAGYRLIWAAMPLSPDTQSFTLRGKAYFDGQLQPSLALTADVTPAQAEQARGANDYGTAASYLSNPWWRQDLSTAPL